MSVRVHPTAVVDPGAVLGDGVQIGPLCVVQAGVEIGEGTCLQSHCVVAGPACIGRRNVVEPFAVIGTPPQDRAWQGEPTRVVVGDNNVIREHVTIHRGTVRGGGETRVGNGNLLMVGVHVAHDVRVGDRVTLTNGTLLGGHAVLEDYVVTGGAAAVAPFARIGQSAFLAAGAMVERDVPPFVIASGDRARVRALNRVGLQRRGVPRESCEALRRAFTLLFRSGIPRSQAVDQLAQALGADPYVQLLVEFVRASMRNKS